MPRRASYIKNLASKLEAIAAAHPGKAMQLWCEDEDREGQKGRTGRRWFTRGERPPGRCDKRFLSTYIFAAVRPGTDDAFALVLPEATAETMDLFLARSTRLAGMARRPCRCRPTSRFCRCRRTRPS